MRRRLPKPLVGSCLVFARFAILSTVIQLLGELGVEGLKPYSDLVSERRGRRRREIEDQDDVYLDLVGSLDSIAAASESEPRVVSGQEKVDENEEKRDTAATDPLNTYLQVGFFQQKTTTEPCRLETGLPSG